MLETTQDDTKSSFQKLHDYLWESNIPNVTIFQGYLVNKATLRYYRSIALLIEITFFLLNFILCGGFSTFAFLTVWGVTSNMIYFGLATSCYFKYKNNKPEISVFNLWKITHIFCEISFTLEMTICVFFWSILAPLMAVQTFSIPWFLNVALHACSPFLILMETLINNVKFYKRHFLIILIIGALYCMVNFAVTESTGNPVYPVITYQSIMTLVYIISAACLSLLFFMIGYQWSCYRFKNEKHNHEERLLTYQTYEEIQIV